MAPSADFLTTTTHDLWHPQTLTQPTPLSTSVPLARTMRRSIFGSVRDKLTRKNTSESQKSNGSRTGLSDLDESPATAMSGSRGRSERSPLQNPSPPTRRPPVTEPPPAYTPNPTFESGPTIPAVGLSAGHARSVSPTPSALSAASTPEDPYAFLSTFDTIFVIDDSGSMAGRSWREVKEALRAIMPICTSHDKDGVDIYFLNHETSASADPKNGKAAGGYNGVTDAAAVERIFTTVRPGRGTPTGMRLSSILQPYLKLLSQNANNMDKVRPINIIVVTDGVPTDDPESILLAAAKKLDKLEAPPYQVGVQFFQVGNEEGAREALRELDDGIASMGDGVRDMVDTVTWDQVDGRATVLTAEGILKTVLGAVVRRLDRRRSTDRRRP